VRDTAQFSRLTRRISGTSRFVGPPQCPITRRLHRSARPRPLRPPREAIRGGLKSGGNTWKVFKMSVMVRRRWEGHAAKRTLIVRCPTRGMAGDDGFNCPLRDEGRRKRPPDALRTPGGLAPPVSDFGRTQGRRLSNFTRFANLGEDERPQMGSSYAPADAAPSCTGYSKAAKEAPEAYEPRGLLPPAGAKHRRQAHVNANLCENERPKMSIAPKRRPMRFTPEPHGRSIRHMPGRADIGTAMIARRAQHGACLIDKPHLGIARQCRGWSFAKTP
jgi:hypothetical protein